jgi:hypothetical protein
MAGFGDNMLAPGIPRSNPSIAGSGLLNTPQIMPNSNPNPIEGDLPTDPLGGSSENPTIPRKGKRGNRPFGGTTANANTNSNNPTLGNSNTSNANVGENADEAKLDQWGVYINKRPTKDRIPDSIEKIKNEVIKIDTPFKVTISATLGPGKDGKTIVLKNPKPIPSETSTTNPEMVKFVQDWIIAVGDAGWFGYLTRIDPKPKNVIITVEQNDTELIASVKADQPTEESAKTQSSALGLLLQGAAVIAKDDEQAFLKKASVTYEGKSFVLNFKIPKSEANGLIMRKLTESNDKEPKPEGNALPKSNDNSARL